MASSILGLVLEQPAAAPAPTKTVHNFGGTRSARPVIPPGLIASPVRDGQFAGLLVAIMQTMGLDELRIDQLLLRDDAGAMGAIEVEQDIYKNQIIIRRRRP